MKQKNKNVSQILQKCYTLELILRQQKTSNI